MRTTLSIDDDVLQAAKTMAEQHHRKLGEVISELARRGLTPPSESRKTRNWISPLSSRKDGQPVTPAIVRLLREDAP